MSCSSRPSIEQNMVSHEQIKSIAKKYSSYDEQNQIFTSETCSSNNSPSESCYSQGDQAKSVFNIEDYLVSTNKNYLAKDKDDFSSAIAAAMTQEQTSFQINNNKNEQMSLGCIPTLNNVNSIFSMSQYNENSATTLSETPAAGTTLAKKSSSKKSLARKCTFLEDEMLDKLEKKVKADDDAQKPIHEKVEYYSNDGTKLFGFNCFPERFLGIPAEFQDKNIAHNSDNDAESSDETILNACRYNLRKIKLELMDLSTTFRYSHFHVDFDKVSGQYKEIRHRKKDSETINSTDNNNQQNEQTQESQQINIDQTQQQDLQTTTNNETQNQ